MMGIIVQKFGGTSVGSVERIKHVANTVKQTVNEGNQVVVVVSAMGKSTNQLVSLAEEISSSPNKRDMDMLLTTGEQVTISLLSMALQEIGCDAVSLTGWQAGIETEEKFGNARITEIHTDKMKNYLKLGKVVVVAGFQGASIHEEIVTLGRGGSDTTAVAIAAALKAEKCDIYTDVNGVYTTDPRVVSDARKLKAISYDEMLELANLGAGVLHPRAVEFAKNYEVILEVRSSFEKSSGTLVEEDVAMEQNLVVRGIAFEDEVAKITVQQLPNERFALGNVFKVLAERGINVDIIIQNVNDQDSSNVSFSIHGNDLKATLNTLKEKQSELGFANITFETDLAKVSIVGAGMISNHGVAAEMFQVLADQGIFIKMVTTSEIKVSTVVDSEDMKKAVKVLHDHFQLAEQEATASL
jgi:aspartate kinase